MNEYSFHLLDLRLPVITPKDSTHWSILKIFLGWTIAYDMNMHRVYREKPLSRKTEALCGDVVID